ncbi:hypothetical protein BD626DRAFT_496662 [Schizophyllum amplum]|uniref:Iron-sulfur assembly protein 1 n=1 Tax=Schizophyllum amplum TaxID=97359 RepID=A0A550CDF3_9AGAR|nr:hypothetical protein BD626DRAFT_496662 [Auriculariopsis ampla]
MSPSLARLSHAARFSSLPFLYPCFTTSHVPVRRAMMSALRDLPQHPLPSTQEQRAPDNGARTTEIRDPEPASLSPDAASPQTVARPPPAPRAERPRPQLRAKKAALSITPTAVERLRTLSKSPTPQLIRIGVRNKGCAGMSYHLEYVDKPGRFDEVVEQDGVKVLIDSKALFSIIGSEMDWKEDALSSKFAFKNPNVVDACGCGDSFSVGS